MEPTLQVLICTYGKEGIRRVARGDHPQVKGVEYIVSWQLSEGEPEIPQELKRPDFKIVTSCSRGLSRNRNIAFSISSAPLLLIADDDIDYYEEGLTGIISSFNDNPDCDILCFRYDCSGGKNFFPDYSFSLNKLAKGYYITSIGIAIRANKIKNHIRFNENFGIGGRLFPCGEEDLFVHDCLKSGLRGKYIPLTICRHEGATTAERAENPQGIIEAKGAVMSVTHPFTWPLRLAMHFLRQCKTPDNPDGIRADGPLPPFAYLRSWLRGVSKGRMKNAFDSHL